ncbi:MAG: twin-arginine translocase subunit TatC [Chloroflexi bacterium]|jgi:sec-independent protein translocase protein TatC|nr:twin-arginine translocase subunit TatC [Chloroflexota bacterium]
MENATEKMPLTSHLEELRKTLMLSLGGLVVGVLVAVFFVKPILNFLAIPIGGMENLHAIEVTETMSVYMRVALLGGLIVALPWILFQIFDFVSKGLKATEKKGIYLALPFAVALFLAGVAFAYFIMLPASLGFFQEILEVTTTIRIKSYFSFTTNLLFWIGVSFQMPLIFFILTKVGLVDYKMLVRGWRVAIVIIAVLAAIITPTGDPINMLIFMVPLSVLYLLSILLSVMAGKRARTEDKEE